MFNIFKRASNRRPPIPENLESYIRMAPPEAVQMRCQIIYSAFPNMSGLLFKEWRDEDGDTIDVAGEKPPFSSVIPTAVANYYFDNSHNTGKLDVDMMREYLGITVENVDDYTPKHLNKDDDADETMVFEESSYAPKHLSKDEVDEKPATPREQKKIAAPLSNIKVKSAVPQEMAPEPEEDPLPEVAPRVNPKKR